MQRALESRVFIAAILAMAAVRSCFMPIRSPTSRSFCMSSPCALPTPS